MPSRRVYPTRRKMIAINSDNRQVWSATFQHNKIAGDNGVDVICESIGFGGRVHNAILQAQPNQLGVTFREVMVSFRLIYHHSQTAKLRELRQRPRL